MRHTFERRALKGLVAAASAAMAEPFDEIFNSNINEEILLPGIPIEAKIKELGGYEYDEEEKEDDRNDDEDDDQEDNDDDVEDEDDCVWIYFQNIVSICKHLSAGKSVESVVKHFHVKREAVERLSKLFTNQQSRSIKFPPNDNSILDNFVTLVISRFSVLSGGSNKLFRDAVTQVLVSSQAL